MAPIILDRRSLPTTPSSHSQPGDESVLNNGHHHDNDEHDEVMSTVSITTPSSKRSGSMPLEATHHNNSGGGLLTPKHLAKTKKHLNGKTLVSGLMFTMIAFVIWDAVLTPPERRWIQPDFADTFLSWVTLHPLQGLLAFLGVIAICVVLMLPIGTPLTLGCGYVYTGAYGWGPGLVIATLVSMGGSAIGAVTCFLLGRYLMRDTVRTWIQQYPLFVAIDVAAAEHGLRIMAMLYLTPILPLGPVSYMCGTTSMALSHFVLAKVASFPLMFFYVFIGASTGMLVSKKGSNSVAAQQQQPDASNLRENETMIVVGIVLSVVMIAGITHYIKKELNKILERQKKHKPGELDDDMDGSEEASVMEMGAMGGTATKKHRRRVG